MAIAYVTEYKDTNAGSPQEPGVDQTVSFTGTAGNSTAFGAQTVLIRITADGTCSYVVGLAAVATTSNKRMAAGTVEFVAVSPGHRVSFITNT